MSDLVLTDCYSSNELAQLRAFAQACLEGWPEDAGLDGFELQDLAEKHGLLEQRTVTEPCGENCHCVEYHGSDGFEGGVICYRKTALLLGQTPQPDDALKAQEQI